MSYSLFVDCSSEILSLALTSQEEVLAQSSGLRARSHNEELGLFVRELLDRQGLRVADLSQIYFGSGPGSFTGLRIGLSFCYGICAANSNINLYLLSSFYGFLPADRLMQNVRWVTFSDAGRGELFVAVLGLSQGQFVEYIKPEIMSRQSFSLALKDWQAEQGGVILRGSLQDADGVPEYERISIADMASNLARVYLAGYKLASISASGVGQLAELSPLYLRSVAARTLKERAECKSLQLEKQG